jgi:hypothetical protein
MQLNNLRRLKCGLLLTPLLKECLPGNVTTICELCIRRGIFTYRRKMVNSKMDPEWNFLSFYRMPRNFLSFYQNGLSVLNCFIILRYILGIINKVTTLGFVLVLYYLWHICFARCFQSFSKKQMRYLNVPEGLKFRPLIIRNI